MVSSPSHVAILVNSVRKTAAYLGQFGFAIGEEEVFKETREIYVQGDRRNSLLLMEPNGPGSYQTALSKRGPGIHHLAIDVLDIDKYLQSLSGSGWLLHLNSLHSIKDLRTAYLARPGFPGLIEVQEKGELLPGPDFVEEISLNLDSSHAPLLESLGLAGLVKNRMGSAALKIQGKEINLESLF